MPGNLLTITRAATLLNVSREFMVKLLDERTIPSVGVGARLELRNLFCWPSASVATPQGTKRSSRWRGMRLKQAFTNLVILPEGAEDE
ncbi:MAG: hypothetical protein U0Q18_00335 [Bryobacteraceae bacterium]